MTEKRYRHIRRCLLTTLKQTNQFILSLQFTKLRWKIKVAVLDSNHNNQISWESYLGYTVLTLYNISSIIIILKSRSTICHVLLRRWFDTRVIKPDMSCLKEVIYVDIQELEKSPDNKIVKEGPGFKHSRALQHHLVKGKPSCKDFFYLANIL